MEQNNVSQYLNKAKKDHDKVLEFIHTELTDRYKRLEEFKHTEKFQKIEDSIVQEVYNIQDLLLDFIEDMETLGSIPNKDVKELAYHYTDLYATALEFRARTMRETMRLKFKRCN